MVAPLLRTPVEAPCFGEEVLLTTMFVPVPILTERVKLFTTAVEATETLPVTVKVPPLVKAELLTVWVLIL